MKKKTNTVTPPKSGGKRRGSSRCCFCGEKYANIGHNPAPLIIDEDAACCSWCNATLVRPARWAAFLAMETADDE